LLGTAEERSIFINKYPRFLISLRYIQDDKGSAMFCLFKHVTPLCHAEERSIFIAINTEDSSFRCATLPMTKGFLIIANFLALPC